MIVDHSDVRWQQDKYIIICIVTDEVKNKQTFVEPCAHKSTQTVFLGGKETIVFTGCGSSAMSC